MEEILINILNRIKIECSENSSCEDCKYYDRKISNGTLCKVTEENEPTPNDWDLEDIIIICKEES